MTSTLLARPPLVAAAVVGAAVLGWIIIGTVPASISPLQVQPFGTRATVTLTSSEPTAIAFVYRSVESPLDTGGVLTTADSPPPAAYQTQHQFELKPLRSNTAYELSVVATTRGGQQLTARTDFTTLKQRVRIALDKISVEQDGDLGGKGEPLWLWRVDWAGGAVGQCYPNNGGLEHQVSICQEGSFGEGEIFPRNHRGQRMQLIFAEENFSVMPQSLELSPDVEENDLIDVLFFPITAIGKSYDPRSPSVTWAVPQDKEFAVEHVPLQTNHSSTGQNLESVMHFSFELFHDNLSYPPNHTHPQVHSIP
ncbi:MAG: hypothetical protein ACHBNF_10935 [Chromatiales bacterium]